MLSMISQIVFMQPIILSALLALPVLWYILRITPPAPKIIIFPPVRFLAGLVAEEHSPNKSPWWILLLRLLMIGLLILALARPVINPAEGLPGRGAIRIIVDNSWASAPVWNTQIKAAQETVIQAAREGRDLYVMPTTPALGEDHVAHYGPLSKSEALSILRGLTPNAWSADYKNMTNAMTKTENNQTIHNFWFSHGLNEGNIPNIARKLQSQGSLTYIRPAPERLALLLRPTKKTLKTGQSDIRINVDAPLPLTVPRPITVQALGGDGNILDIQSDLLNAESLPHTVHFEVTESLKNNLSRYQISGRYGAGGIYLLDDRSKKKKVGIAASAQQAETAPLIESGHYITRALEPFANITVAEPLTLIKNGAAVIILPDIAAMPTETLNALEEWVNDGGLLLRYAGPNIADSRSDPFLMPVRLRAGGRSLSGSLSWDEPQKIAPFSDDSPFFGLEIPDDINIEQQVLADPAQDLEGKIWASLTDGTPFITAAPQDRGLIILVHTTANTDWSDFALSGLYVSTLRRIIALAGQSGQSLNINYKSLEPILIMDGNGALSTPPASVRPLPIETLNKIKPSSIHPPGIYGSGSMSYAVNASDNLPALQITENLPLSIYQNQYETEYELDLMPYLLYAALLLFLIDWLVMIFIIGSGLKYLRRAPLLLVLFSTPAFADDQRDIQYASGFYLAYIQTGDDTLDATARQGLENLAKTLKKRTSIVPKGVTSLNPEQSTLTFFPLIYWPIGAKQTRYSGQAMQNIQFYLDHGGTILFDTRDQNRSTRTMRNTPNAQALRQITSNLNIPPITPVPDDHVLGRSFYLLKNYPGRYKAGTLWVEQYSAQGRDNVSSVLIGSNDWASAWSAHSGNKSSRQDEMAMRFGINLVMYALTGNYKADQVHIPHILKRLGQ